MSGGAGHPLAGGNKDDTHFLGTDNGGVRGFVSSDETMKQNGQRHKEDAFKFKGVSCNAAKGVNSGWRFVSPRPARFGEGESCISPAKSGTAAAAPIPPQDLLRGSKPLETLSYRAPRGSRQLSRGRVEV